MLVIIRAGEMLVREKLTVKTLIRLLHQKQSDLGLCCCLSLFDRHLGFKTLEHEPYNDSVKLDSIFIQ